MKTASAIDYVGKDGKLKTNQHPTIKVKDLADLKPAYDITPGILVQGTEIENGLLYTVTGFADALDTPTGNYIRHSYVQLRIYTYDGTKVGEYFLTNSGATDEPRPKPNDNVKVHYLNNKKIDSMVNQKDTNGKTTLYHTGYFENEGIRVSDGVVYLSFTSLMKKPNDSVNYWRHFVFKYDLTKKKASPLTTEMRIPS